MERLKEAYRELNPDSSIAQLARDTIRSSEEALNAFSDAASDAVVNYRLQEGQKNNAPEGEKYSLRTTTDGRLVAVVDDNILANIDTENWTSATKKAAQKAASKALMKFSDGIIVNGITRKVNKVFENQTETDSFKKWLGDWQNDPDIRFSQRVSAEERVERMETEIQYLKKLVQIQKRGKVA